MANLNPLHRFLHSKHPSPVEGQGGSVFRRDVSGLDSLIQAARSAGLLTYRDPTGIGPYRYSLTAIGAAFLRG